jgi:hypothetical protein
MFILLSIQSIFSNVGKLLMISISIFLPEFRKCSGQGGQVLVVDGEFVQDELRQLCQLDEIAEVGSQVQVSCLCALLQPFQSLQSRTLPGHRGPQVTHYFGSALRSEGEVSGEAVLGGNQKAGQLAVDHHPQEFVQAEPMVAHHAAALKRSTSRFFIGLAARGNYF